MRASVVVTYYTKLYRTGADRNNFILMSLLLLVADTKKEEETENKKCVNLQSLLEQNKNLLDSLKASHKRINKSKGKRKLA